MKKRKFSLYWRNTGAVQGNFKFNVDPIAYKMAFVLKVTKFKERMTLY